jgi:hypothetical protein
MITFCNNGVGSRPKIRSGMRKIPKVSNVYQGASLNGSFFASGFSNIRLSIQTKYPAVIPGTSTAIA